MTSSISEKIVDWWSKGLQLSACYKEDWEYIKSVFYKLDLTLDAHSPIITMHEVSNVRYAYELSKVLEIENPKYRRKDIFLIILRAFPIYSKLHARLSFERDINPTLLTELISVNGTIKNNNTEYERILKKALKNGKKSHNITRKSINISIRN